MFTVLSSLVSQCLASSYSQCLPFSCSQESLPLLVFSPVFPRIHSASLPRIHSAFLSRVHRRASPPGDSQTWRPGPRRRHPTRATSEHRRGRGAYPAKTCRIGTRDLEPLHVAMSRGEATPILIYCPPLGAAAWQRRGARTRAGRSAAHACMMRATEMFACAFACVCVYSVRVEQHSALYLYVQSTREIKCQVRRGETPLRPAGS